MEPRYWDPKKEQREARERRIKAELGIKDEAVNYIPYIGKGDFRKGFSNGKWSVKRQLRRSNIRLLVIVVVLAILIYFMLK